MTDPAGLPPLGRRSRILLITGDPIREQMAGPAIRVWHMAQELATVCDVRVVSWRRIERSSARFELFFVHESDDAGMRVHEQWADAIVVQGISLRIYPSVATTEKVVIADLYDPFHLEQLEQNRHEPAARWDEEVRKAVSLLDEQLTRADCVLCASERQRDLWLGSLSTLGRLNPLTYAEDPTYESFVRIVPFGLPAEPPRQTRHAIRGAVPGIEEDDKILIWGGGIYNWFDPVTLVEAMGLLADTNPEIKLFFLSSRHFDSQVPEMQVLAETVARADLLGLTDRTVFFNESWVDYDDRVNFLMDADIGVSTHVPHVETRFSFRTRILDYIWAGLPIVATDGDTFAEVINEHGLGRVVPPRDAPALVEAILAVLYDPSITATARSAMRRVQERYAWPQTMAPLVDFCRDPRRSPDGGGDVRRAGDRFSRILSMPKGLRRDIALLRYYAANGGWGLVNEKLRGRRRRLEGER